MFNLFKSENLRSVNDDDDINKYVYHLCKVIPVSYTHLLIIFKPIQNATKHWKLATQKPMYTQKTPNQKPTVAKSSKQPTTVTSPARKLARLTTNVLFNP